MRVVRDFDRVYMPDGMCIINSAVDGQSGEDSSRRSDLERKAENITGSYSEVFPILTSADISQAEAARLLKTITNVMQHNYASSVFISVTMLIPLTNCLFFQLKFSPADIPHTSLRTMATNVRRAMMPECEIYKIELADGDLLFDYLISCQLFNLFDLFEYIKQLTLHLQRWTETSCLTSIG